MFHLGVCVFVQMLSFFLTDVLKICRYEQFLRSVYIVGKPMHAKQPTAFTQPQWFTSTCAWYALNSSYNDARRG